MRWPKGWSKPVSGKSASGLGGCRLNRRQISRQQYYRCSINDRTISYPLALPTYGANTEERSFSITKFSITSFRLCHEITSRGRGIIMTSSAEVTAATAATQRAEKPQPIPSRRRDKPQLSCNLCRRRKYSKLFRF